LSLRINSSVFPENIDPQITSIQPPRFFMLVSFSRNIDAGVTVLVNFTSHKNSDSATQTKM